MKRKVCFDTPSTLADKGKPDGVESCREDRATGARGGGVLGGGSRARIGRPAAALSAVCAIFLDYFVPFLCHIYVFLNLCFFIEF